FDEHLAEVVEAAPNRWFSAVQDQFVEVRVNVAQCGSPDRFRKIVVEVGLKAEGAPVVAPQGKDYVHGGDVAKRPVPPGVLADHRGVHEGTATRLSGSLGAACRERYSAATPTAYAAVYGMARLRLTPALCDCRAHSLCSPDHACPRRTSLRP